MSKPAYKLLPSGTLLVYLSGKKSAIFLVFVEYGDKFTGCFRIKHESIDFVVVSEASTIQIRTSYGAIQTIYHHDFGVMETSVEDVDICTFLS